MEYYGNLPVNYAWLNLQYHSEYNEQNFRSNYAEPKYIMAQVCGMKAKLTHDG